LYTRWLQAGVFYPFMRTHTTFGTPDQEPWSYGVDYEVINRRAIELRYQLLPYIYNVMHEAAETGIPAMRPLMLEDPNDGGIDDEFLFGSDLLIAPVLRAGVTERGVYLPRGEWYDFWSGKRYSGGKGITVPVTLASIPIFVRGGAFIFGQPVVQHTGEMPGQPLEVTLYPSGDSERWLYEDSGNGYDYQRGAYARRRFTARKNATGLMIEISAPEGSYRPASRALVIAVKSVDAVSVRIGSVALARVDDLAKTERGWTVRDGSVVIKFPDTFERTEVRIDHGGGNAWLSREVRARGLG
jgi:alpha-glucosidase